MTLKNLFKENVLLNILLFTAVLTGIIVRFKGLGTWPLTIDEYYIAKSANNILQFGLPKWEVGGYYTRGIIQQYITAGLYHLGVNLEFGARIFPVLMNILAILPLYILTKKISNKIIAVFVVVVFSLSVWEIEMARFARMYAPFQAVFVAYLLFLYKALIEKDKSAFKWIFILSFISIFVYEGNIFLALLNFIPVFWDPEKNSIDFSNLWKLRFRFVHLLFAILVLVCVYGFREINFKEGAPSFPQFAEEYYAAGESTNKFFQEGLLKKPVLLVSAISGIQWIVPFALILLFSFYSSFRLFSSHYNISVKLSLIYILVLSVLNLFGMVVLSLLIFMLIGWLKRGDLRNIYRQPFLISLLLFFIFWFFFSYFTSEWQVSYAGKYSGGFSAKLKNIFLALFNYPDNYFQVWRYYYVMPSFTIILFLIMPYGFYRLINDFSNTAGVRFSVFTALLIFMMISLLDIPGSTRYSFLLFPVVLIFLVFTFYHLSLIISGSLRQKALVMASMVLLFFFISEDFSIRHLLNIDSKEINFRTIYGPALKEHYYPRWDIVTPAEYVNKNAAKEDIIIINEYNLEPYLKDLDYMYVNYKEGRFFNAAIEGGTKARWTNSGLIWHEDDLYKMLYKNGSTVWYISKNRNSRNLPYYDELMKHSVCTNIDSSFNVFKFENK